MILYSVSIGMYVCVCVLLVCRVGANGAWRYASFFFLTVSVLCYER